MPLNTEASQPAQGRRVHNARPSSELSFHDVHQADGAGAIMEINPSCGQRAC